MTSMAQDLPKENISVAFALRGLSPHTDYVITVVANTSAGYGNRSEELHIQTKMQRACMHVCVCCECTILVDVFYVHVNRRMSGHGG